MNEYHNLQQRVSRYHEVLTNTNTYRQFWTDQLRQDIVNQLQHTVDATGLKAKVEVRSQISNLEAVVLTLGMGNSGLSEPVGEGISRELIKHHGSLVYQQLFNGKVLVLINFPFIEKYGQPQPPKTIAIYRPEEIKEPFILRHVETLIHEVTNWEDYDDDNPEPNQRIGFKVNFEDSSKSEK
jgi:putative component of toxin-antitoxin plasmid stabilization module